MENQSQKWDAMTTKSQSKYLKAVARFEAEMATGDLGRIKLAEASLARATRKAAQTTAIKIEKRLCGALLRS